MEHGGRSGWPTDSDKERFPLLAAGKRQVAPIEEFMSHIR